MEVLDVEWMFDAVMNSYEAMVSFGAEVQRDSCSLVLECEQGRRSGFGNFSLLSLILHFHCLPTIARDGRHRRPETSVRGTMPPLSITSVHTPSTLQSTVPPNQPIPSNPSRRAISILAC